MPWISTREEKPKEGQIVPTKIDDGQGLRNQGLLKWQSGRWFLPDGSMYVYYTPTHWHKDQ